MQLGAVYSLYFNSYSKTPLLTSKKKKEKKEKAECVLQLCRHGKAVFQSEGINSGEMGHF